MKVVVSLSAAEWLAAKWEADAARCERVTQAALSDLGRELVQHARQLVDAGRYAESFVARPVGSAVEAGSKSPLAAVIERGRRPGRRPPAASIQKRAGGSFEAAEKAAARIAAQGTRGRFIVKRANAAMRKDGTTERIAREALRAIVEG